MLQEDPAPPWCFTPADLGLSAQCPVLLTKPRPGVSCGDSGSVKSLLPCRPMVVEPLLKSASGCRLEVCLSTPPWEEWMGGGRRRPRTRCQGSALLYRRGPSAEGASGKAVSEPVFPRSCRWQEPRGQGQTQAGRKERGHGVAERAQS